MTAAVYSITVLPTGKRYVGSTQDVTTRWRNHRGQLARNEHGNSFLQRSWNKYGARALAYEIIENVDDVSVLIEREQFHLDALKPELNLSPVAGNCRGMKLSAEARQKISASNHRRWANATPEDRTRIGAAMLSGQKPKRPLSAETRAKISAANQGKPHGLKGVPLTAEHRARIASGVSIYRKGRALSPAHRSAISVSALGKKRGPYKTWRGRPVKALSA